MYQLITFQTTTLCLRNLMNRSHLRRSLPRKQQLPRAQAMWIIRGLLLLMLALVCFAFSPAPLAVTPALDGSYPNQNTAENDDALFIFTTGANNTAMGFDALDSNTIGSGNAPASGNWTLTGSLNTARDAHTATLLQNGMVLVAGGADNNDTASASAEMYDPASGTWTGTRSLKSDRDADPMTLLQNGMVLVAGGFSGAVLGSAELYNPASGTWTLTGSLNT